MQVSYNEACAKNCSDLLLDLRLCEDAGFDYIEIRLDMLREYLEKHSVDELAGFFKTSHIKPHAFNAVYLYPEFLSENDDLEKQKALMSDFMLAMETGKAIGSHYVIIVPPLQRNPNGEPFQGDLKAVQKECVRILKQLSELAESYGMNLCFELVGFDRSSVRSIEEADAIVRAVNRENVGFVFDSYNIYLNGGSNDFSGLKKVQTEKIFAIHLMSADDVPAEARGQDKRCFTGKGVIDTDAFLGVLKEIGYKGMVSVETFRPEYWKKSPEWVIKEAFQTTCKALYKNGCLTNRKS